MAWILQFNKRSMQVPYELDIVWKLQRYCLNILHADISSILHKYCRVRVLMWILGWVVLCKNELFKNGGGSQSFLIYGRSSVPKYFLISLMFSYRARHFYVSCSILSGLKWPPIKKRKSYKSLPNQKILKSFGMHFFDPRPIKASRRQRRNLSRISVYSIKGNILTWLFRLYGGFHAFKLNSNT